MKPANGTMHRTRLQAAVGRARLRSRRLLGPLACLLAVLMLLPGGASGGEVYRWKDADGVTHYSDSKPPDQAAERLRIVPDAPARGPAPVPPVAAPAVPATSSTPAVASQPDILMYGSPTCGWCLKAERYFAQRGLAYRNIDVTASDRNRKAFEQAGGRGTPLIFVNGRRLRGFNADRLDAAIAAAR